MPVLHPADGIIQENISIPFILTMGKIGWLGIIVDGLIRPRLKVFPDHRSLIKGSSPMQPFFVADLNTQGELREITEYDYAALERIPGATDLIARCSGELYKNPEEMEVA